MAAEEGNSYAEKWTKETVLPLLEKIEKEAKKETCFWLGEAILSVGLYRDIWQYWKDKFEKDEDVFRTIKRVDQIFENRLFVKGAKGKINSTLAIFGLKNNHKWTDKTEVDHTSGGQPLETPKQTIYINHRKKGDKINVE